MQFHTIYGNIIMHMTADTSCCLAGKHGFTQEDMYGKEIMVNTIVGYSFKLREAPPPI